MGGESPEQDGDGRFKAKVAESGEELDRSGGLAVVGDKSGDTRTRRGAPRQGGGRDGDAWRWGRQKRRPQ